MKRKTDDERKWANGWNYRVMRRWYDPIGDGKYDGEYEYGIYEVYYDSKGKPSSWSTDATKIVASGGPELADEFARLQRALTLPTLEYDTGGNVFEWREV